MGGKDFFCDGLSHGATPIRKTRKGKTRGQSAVFPISLVKPNHYTRQESSSIYFLAAAAGAKGPEHLYRWDPIAYTAAAARRLAQELGRPPAFPGFGT
jgi:hypothetical protein